MPRPRKIKNSLIEEVVDDMSRAVIEASQSEPQLPAVAIDLRRMIDKAISENDWLEIFRMAKGKALDGERLWAEFLTKYRWGLPPQMVQHGGKVGAGVVIVEVIKSVDQDIDADDPDIIDGEVEQIE